jgi:hypothetical protein
MRERRGPAIRRALVARREGADGQRQRPGARADRRIVDGVAVGRNIGPMARERLIPW